MVDTVAAPEVSVLALPSSEHLTDLSDLELQQRQRDFASARRLVDAGSARVAAELARRSAPELGYAGLAQREGVRSAAQLIERLAGVTPAEARALVRVGEHLDAPEALKPVTEAVAVGDLGVAAADAITSGLGEPSATVTPEALALAADMLVALSPQLPSRELGAQARRLRDQLDSAGIADREQHLRDKRYARIHTRADGMTRIDALLAPEEAAVAISAFDCITAPRRGGPRFVDAAEAARAQRIVDDPRTTEQLLADALVEMIRLAAGADTGRLFGQRKPAVVIHVDRRDLESGEGAAHIEGQSAAVSIATARRLACASGSVPVLFDGAEPLDVGRTQRLYTERQRVALAARDGGCRWLGCDRPPSWCEAHHIDEWHRDGGRTDVAAGVLLCRFHHMMTHNQGWRIRKRGPDYVAIPPPGTGEEVPLRAGRTPARA